MKLVVFTDLDGTLLDHETYGHEAAAPALARLREVGATLVMASSKTAAEIAPLRAEVGFEHCPAIVENGAGLLPPGPLQDADAGDYARLRAALDALPGDLRAGFQGFGDWTEAEVAARTGLPPSAAALARRRRFSEPGIWSGPEGTLDAFLSALAEAGVAGRRGGRFLTLSFGRTKADAMAEALAGASGPVRSVALGDAPNDVEILEAADIGFVVANPSSTPLPPLRGEAEGRIRRTSLPGPAGWNEAVLSVLEGPA